MKVRLKVNALIGGQALRAGTILERSELPAWLNKNRYIEPVEAAAVNSQEPGRSLRRRRSEEEEQQGPV